MLLENICLYERGHRIDIFLAHLLSELLWRLSEHFTFSCVRCRSLTHSIKLKGIWGGSQEQFNWQMEEMVTGSEISGFSSTAESRKGCWCAAGEWSLNSFNCFCQQQIDECSHSPFWYQSFGHKNLLLMVSSWEQLHHWPACWIHKISICFHVLSDLRKFSMFFWRYSRWSERQREIVDPYNLGFDQTSSFCTQMMQ